MCISFSSFWLTYFDAATAFEFKASACSKINYKFLLVVCLWWVVCSILYLAMYLRKDKCYIIENACVCGCSIINKQLQTNQLYECFNNLWTRVILDFVVQTTLNQESTTSSSQEFLIWLIHAAGFINANERITPKLSLKKAIKWYIVCHMCFLVSHTL